MSERWKTTRLLGRGAMGTVHLVERDDGTLAALKRLTVEEHAEVLAGYGHLAELRHPHIAAVLEVGTDVRGGFVVLEYVEGLPLGDLLRKVAGADEDVPVPVAVEILEHLAGGLAALHQWNRPPGSVGWVHRDVSPSNALVGGDGRTRIADLDLAAPRAAVRGLHSEETRGKLSYAAPELLAGTGASDRSDVFSLGVVAFETLVLSPLFTGPERDPVTYTIDLGEAVMDREDLPAPLVELLFEMLATRPESRPAAAAVAERAAAIRAELPAVDVGAYVASFLESPHQGARPATANATVPPTASATWRVKGSTLVATTDYLVQSFGEEAYARVLDHLSPRARECLQEPLDSVRWYDGGILTEVTDAAGALLGTPGPSMASAIAIWSAEQALGPGGPYQTFRDKGLRKGVSAFLETTEDIYGLYYDAGRWRVVEVSETSARCRLEDVNLPGSIVDRILAYLTRGLELVGAKAVRIASRVQTEAGLEVVVRWS